MDLIAEKITTSVEDTELFAERISSEVKGGDIICYFGEVGAGKTVFTRGLCKGLGVTGYVNSPSYIILNQYIGSKYNIFHYDLYRISDVEELTEIGFYDFAGKSDSITIIEWSEKLVDELPKNRFDITIEVIDETKRKFKIRRYI
ncbi:MAG: tRNA (adenosine(37)-N6)-threonylcarbamoyltransferase complex ATPase subunit type 1 TsaE [Candidatus Delongbacteria bacterium]|jgi:tRNA threonylcarbamoyladenosine biosynthesis protein TsaE|nr:tRNA (adenosine(37)-N6)-threonylcarbamoyltransferase complex ATPase subunit type 1 TsaE [Candidatus Delongbacteria bacterium]